jgi:hypothetical protein
MQPCCNISSTLAEVAISITRIKTGQSKHPAAGQTNLDCGTFPAAALRMGRGLKLKTSFDPRVLRGVMPATEAISLCLL